MKTLMRLMFFAGLLLGPGYHLYTRWFSGEVVKRESIYGRPPGQTGDGRLHALQWLTPVKIRLTPEMNPVALDFSHDSMEKERQQGREYLNTYETRVSHEGDVKYNGVWRLGYQIMRKGMSKQSTSNRLTMLNVTRAGDYEFDMKPVDESGVNVRRLDLEVRRNVGELNEIMCGIGYVALAGSMLFGWWRLKQGQGG